MIQTSYFSNPLLKGREAECVAISRGLPMYTRRDFYARRLDLAPTKEIMHIEDEARYRERYFGEILAKLDPAKVAEELEGKILLCFEKPNGERVEQELKPSGRALLKAGPAKPHDAEYHHAKFPNLYDILNQNDQM